LGIIVRYVLWKEKKRRCCDVSIFLIKCDCKRWVILMSDDRNLKTSKFAPSFLRSFVRSFVEVSSKLPSKFFEASCLEKFEASFEVLRSFLRKSSFFYGKKLKIYSNYRKNLLFSLKMWNFPDSRVVSFGDCNRIGRHNF
jgi:hypothetical protein